MKTIQMIFGTHNSQPVGNFDSVVEGVYQHAYKPFLCILNKHPEFPVTLHYCGALFEWIEEKHPEFLMLLDEMVKRKQVELLGGGYYEPVLSMIPNSDKLGQIEHLTTFIRSRFGKRPRGTWVTERVWEPSCASILKNSGIDYSFLDDIHFKAAGVDDHGLYYPYLTEDHGKIIAVFPISKPLRYIIPYKEPDDVINYIKSLATEEGNRVVTIIDDGEKFGEWKGSYERCYKENWLCRFIELVLESADCIVPVHPARYLKMYACREKVYFPSMLYDEMMDWVLSPSRSQKLAEIRRKMAIKSGENGFLPGGLFKGFFCKYPESNLMYAKMMYVNIFVNQIRNDKYKKKAAKTELWKGQCNHAYWHGKFGGIYLNHLRKEVYRSLIEAELLTRDKGLFLPSIISADFDMDGTDEYLYQGEKINAYVHSKGGILFELDYLSRCWNYLDSLSRYIEYYHGYMERENGYDWYMRKAFIDHIFAPGTTNHSFKKMEYIELGDFINNTYECTGIDKENFELMLKRDGMVRLDEKLIPLRIEKKYIFKTTYIDVQYTLTNISDQTYDLFFGIEINLAFSYNNTDDFCINIIKNKQAIPVDNGDSETEHIESVIINDLHNNATVTLSSQKEFSLFCHPVETISQSIDTLDRIYQSTCFVTAWNLSLAPEDTWTTVHHLSLKKKK
jgi:alpha-amylase/alpha-mannosidase (GH57 family)